MKLRHTTKRTLEGLLLRELYEHDRRTTKETPSSLSPMPLCIMGSCAHVGPSLFRLSFTNLYSFPILAPVTVLGAQKAFKKKNIFNAFSTFTTKYNQRRLDILKRPQVIKIVSKPSRYLQQLLEHFYQIPRSYKSRPGPVSWKLWLLVASQIRSPVTVSLASLRNQARVAHSSLKAALDKAASPGIPALTSQEERAPRVPLEPTQMSL